MIGTLSFIIKVNFQSLAQIPFEHEIDRNLDTMANSEFLPNLTNANTSFFQANNFIFDMQTCR